ncbi:MAG: hypothetical protein A2186_00075 [Candidatus Levybacteria bacterium RIFOXYA1_FULL_41_10]|nr:MAG: FKBP-type peptidyl-prolyl cis-trans isomerase (PPIase), FKBP-type peptidyl-prolyl cis-trans isomerase FkpA [Candidatus Levybacteria bacterium GW2011_GWC1_40_19]KKR94952.1 MAG: Peptidyl-prolyl cis-trans isomerase [Candidatus Levybacteria bacterium GW2011_GWA2_41_15]OGH27377.1 MAG: hypothetical protein A3D82_01605 [Candidatus Levybacteria bacterium RIFCSPHIGHO2_02_FULL_40_29]OGH50027.1 MAG: hypothetical protein A3J18_04000 [Candidatus Levybacteria bacterium RIFCSPLOWO2_02_FULL_40_18]OGH51
MERALAAVIIILVLVGIGFLILRERQSTTNTTDDFALQTVTPSPRPESPTLKIEDLKVGTGAAVKEGDTITIHYQGALSSGQVFDSSYKRGTPFETEIGVGRVIEGWDRGVLGMKVGGKRRLIVPPSLAYGTSGVTGVIPPNATLMFELELLAIKEKELSPTPTEEESESPTPTPQEEN